VFNTHKKLKLGPGEYDYVHSTVKKNSPAPNFKKEPEALNELVIRAKEEVKLLRKFDGSCSTIKKLDKQPLHEIGELEERALVPVFGEEPGIKSANVFQSVTNRFDKRGHLGENKNPGPGFYVNNTKEPQYIVKGASQSTFGSSVERNVPIQRDVLRSPFVDPTSVKNPSPNHYKVNNGVAFKFNQQSTQAMNNALNTSSRSFAQFNESFVSQDSKVLPSYKSNVGRDFLDQVSKEQKLSPGPGSYIQDQLMHDKMKALSYQVCQRY